LKYIFDMIVFIGQLFILSALLGIYFQFIKGFIDGYMDGVKNKKKKDD